MSLDHHSPRFHGCCRTIWRDGYVAECAPRDGLESIIVFLNVPFGLEGRRTVKGFEGRRATLGRGLQRRWLDGGPNLLGPAVAYRGAPCRLCPGTARPSRSPQAPGVVQAGGHQRMRRRPRPFERAPGRTGFLRALMSAPPPDAFTGDHRRTAAGPTEIMEHPAPACFLPCLDARRLWTGQLKPSSLDSRRSNSRPIPEKQQPTNATVLPGPTLNSIGRRQYPVSTVIWTKRRPRQPQCQKPAHG
jgi:hypothetical protein